MRRATRSSSGRPTSPDAELFQEYHKDRNTRSRKPSGLPISPDAELWQEPEERATRSRKPSEDLVVLELPRITRIGKRSGSSGRSPEPPKLSPRGGRSAEGGHKHEKRGLSPAEESPRETSTKKRRRSGRVVEEDVEKEKQEMQEKDEKDDGDKRDKVSEKKGKSPRERKHDGNLKEKGVKEKDPKEKEDKEVKAKVKDKHQDNVTKEHKKVEDSTTASIEPSGKSRRRTRSGRQGIDGDEESSTHSHQTTQQDSKPDLPEKGDGGKSTDEPAAKHQSSKDHGRPSSKSGQDKEKLDVPRLRSPPRSPEKSRKVETAKVELLNINLDLGELTVKTSSKPPPRGALSPSLRMSPRRARQPSGQKSSDDPESIESKDTQDKNSGEEINTPSTAPSHKESTELNTASEKDQTKDKPGKRKKSAIACRDISKDFDESKEIPQSPTRLTRARKEEDFPAQKEDTPGKDDEILSWDSKSNKAKKSRSPMKSPRDSLSLSPRKGLRSGRADGTPDHNRAQEQEQVKVVAMEMEQIPPPVSAYTSMAQKGVTVSQGEEQDVRPLPELERAPTFGELLAAEKQAKAADDVTEISDEVAAKIREWRVHEEESVGFQGEEWYAEEVDEGEPFYYESDHMALKGNKDYRMLLRTITTLEAQRKQAVKDLDKLVTAQREALRNPLKFVHRLQKKDTLHLPSPQRIVLLPEIPWGRYLGHPDSKELILGLSHQTRASLKPKDSAEDPGAGTSSSSIPIDDQDEDEKNKSVIRGRLWDETKPDTFNRLWTVGEQKRLEDLLTTHPSEEVEARRWEKIAKDLGNRTRHQVASRVQKYFIKLGKAGLPIPGRMPNMATYTLKKPTQRRYMNPYNRLTCAPSTFLQSIRAPVLMNEDDDDAFDYEMDYDADSIMEEDDIPSELKGSEEYKELVRLKKLRNITLKQQTDMSHAGYSCDGCDVSPIVGVRWHCVNCPMEISTDLCQSCVNDDFQSEVHRSSHRMDPVHIGQSAGFVDSDYTSFTGTSGDYNYLDPNYSPAVL
ncbi:ZZ-type zinc finger-containing protein 3-like isoform X2 [Strongylocentrotus purpuratus]|uniref:ZZ-type zinc finger-containing protein 3 n=1 Tax=Strongylocentrotus purpuratus TaxID=7668 RepID=A0A7M7PQH8_STRPU|nr:ZZ-type zinc finger-containing protein 3-like isoform X1 [Strongylocentrotus purpuratus]XP_030853556.1 ZZ-type zinc finger-containing protein 3-like isoform X2 [Strongylocentrotus purpuratus]